MLKNMLEKISNNLEFRDKVKLLLLATLPIVGVGLPLFNFEHEGIYIVSILFVALGVLEPVFSCYSGIALTIGNSRRSLKSSPEFWRTLLPYFVVLILGLSLFFSHGLCCSTCSEPADGDNFVGVRVGFRFSTESPPRERLHRSDEP